jgi:ubiquinone/menaquinone biosynthesis C-methylase UbiE
MHWSLSVTLRKPKAIDTQSKVLSANGICSPLNCAHRLWKHYTIATSNVKAGDKVLDIAGGTGDLACAFAMKVGATGHQSLKK